ncbi:hypothetical protein TWF128_001699 [Orbilia oligospora]|nr:hypothetical protein TWF128_001699 [Orbilia oligospora]
MQGSALGNEIADAYVIDRRPYEVFIAGTANVEAKEFVRFKTAVLEQQALALQAHKSNTQNQSRDFNIRPQHQIIYHDRNDRINVKFSQETTVIMSYPASSDLLWEITRNNSSFLVKRKTGSGVRLSRDPLNLRNVHSRKHSGAVNNQAIGIVPSGKGGISLLTKKKGTGATISQSYKPSKTSRKAYVQIANSTTKKGYRADLREDAIARASALIRSYRKSVKPTKESKPRGSKAKASAASAASADL